jgi:CheY-like chemotaxis protein
MTRVFCDIEMPRCDGLELLSRISKEPSLSQLPIARADIERRR